MIVFKQAMNVVLQMQINDSKCLPVTQNNFVMQVNILWSDLMLQIECFKCNIQ